VEDKVKVGNTRRTPTKISKDNSVLVLDYERVKELSNFPSTVDTVVKEWNQFLQDKLKEGWVLYNVLPYNLGGESNRKLLIFYNINPESK
jgi:hypothetical protein